MHQTTRRKGPLSPYALAALTSSLFPLAALGQTTQDIRIVSYNTQDDVGTGGDSGPTPQEALPNIATTLEGVGQQKYVGDGILQLPDIIALQETTSNSTTVQPLVSDLNSYYGSNIFSYSTYQATTDDGNTFGGGPNGLIYNQLTLNLINSVGVGTPTGEQGTSGNGAFRQPVMYEFQPIADKGTSNGIFYIFDDHYKSGSASTSDDGTTDGNLRNLEAQTVRNYEAANLPANADVLYVGDYNLDGSSEAMYQTLTAADSPSGVDQGQAIDPLNPTDNYTESWENNSTYKGIMTEKDTKLEYRDDLQTMTANVYDDANGNLDYISNSLHAFGNNGSTNVNGTIDSTSNTALNDIVGNGPLTPTQVYNAMNASIGSDHLPVVADYSIEIGPFTLTWNNAGGTGNGTTWDTSSQNWNNGSAETTYSDGSAVIFNDTNNGNYSVTLSSTVSPGSVTVNNSNGNYVISGAGSIAGTGMLSKSGSSALTLNTVNTYSGGTSISAGTLIAGVNGALPNGSIAISGGTIQLAANTGLAQMTSLNISGNGVLDIANNHVIITYGSSDPISTIIGYIETGFNNGSWNGPGIISSTAAASDANPTAPQYGIGFSDGADQINGNPIVSGLSSGEIELKYTLLGDANLDGTVNGSDFSILAANFGQGYTNWDQGNFLFTPAINGTDFSALAANFGQGDNGADAGVSKADIAALDAFAAANGLLADVPEPGTILGLCPLLGLGLLRRRRSIYRPA